jgi:oligopeptide/dipeptide ABC transporter ATP-binding protein
VSQTGAPVFSIRGLVVEFQTRSGTLRAVDGVSLEVRPGETVGIVGESGSGKTVTVMGSLRLVAQPPARIVDGEVIFDGEDLMRLPSHRLREVRGRHIGVIFQDPTTYLNPVLTVGDQIGEALRAHDRKLSKRAARSRAAQLLARVGVPSATVRVRQYPHEFSGGMRQRVLIAIATANQPRLLIADEPTTALDVTVQAEILEAIRAAQAETGAASVFVTHDFGVIAEIADRVIVMYAGRIIEQGDVEAIFLSPRHPYTASLLASRPQFDRRTARRLMPIAGSPPDLRDLPSGCAFHPRCRLMRTRATCVERVPDLIGVGENHASACHFAEETESLMNLDERITS